MRVVCDDMIQTRGGFRGPSPDTHAASLWVDWMGVLLGSYDKTVVAYPMRASKRSTASELAAVDTTAVEFRPARKVHPFRARAGACDEQLRCSRLGHVFYMEFV